MRSYAGRIADRADQDTAAWRAGDDGPQRQPEPRAVERNRTCGGRRAHDRRRRPEATFASATQLIGRAEPGRDRQGSFGARLHSGVRRQGKSGREFRSLSCRCRLASRSHLLHVRRYECRHRPAPGPDVGIRRSRRRADAARSKRGQIRQYFGDTVKATAEFSYVSLGLGMVLGVLLGLIPIPIPGVGTVTLGIGGGPLIVALILGQAAPHRPDALGHAVARQYRAAQFRSGHVPRLGRHQRRTAIRADDRETAASRCCSSAWRCC